MANKREKIERLILFVKGESNAILDVEPPKVFSSYFDNTPRKEFLIRVDKTGYVQINEGFINIDDSRIYSETDVENALELNRAGLPTVGVINVVIGRLEDAPFKGLTSGSYKIETYAPVSLCKLRMFCGITKRSKIL